MKIRAQSIHGGFMCSKIRIHIAMVQSSSACAVHVSDELLRAIHLTVPVNLTTYVFLSICKFIAMPVRIQRLVNWRNG